MYEILEYLGGIESMGCYGNKTVPSLILEYLGGIERKKKGIGIK